jgi:hypothetical protein
LVEATDAALGRSIAAFGALKEYIAAEESANSTPEPSARGRFSTVTASEQEGVLNSV